MSLLQKNAAFSKSFATLLVLMVIGLGGFSYYAWTRPCSPTTAAPVVLGTPTSYQPTREDEQQSRELQDYTLHMSAFIHASINSLNGVSAQAGGEDVTSKLLSDKGGAIDAAIVRGVTTECEGDAVKTAEKTLVSMKTLPFSASSFAATTALVEKATAQRHEICVAVQTLKDDKERRSFVVSQYLPYVAVLREARLKFESELGEVAKNMSPTMDSINTLRMVTTIPYL
jgi:hypothetical protein